MQFDNSGNYETMSSTELSNGFSKQGLVWDSYFYRTYYYTEISPDITITSEYSWTPTYSYTLVINFATYSSIGYSENKAYGSGLEKQIFDFRTSPLTKYYVKLSNPSNIQGFTIEIDDQVKNVETSFF